MIYHIRAISNESDDFLFDIAIDGDFTFLELNDFIQEKLDYDPSHLSSFFITDDEWNKEIEVVPIDMGEGAGDSLLMEKSTLASLLTDVKQRFIYVFDLFNERILFMELAQIDEGELKNPVCTKLVGTPPIQFKDNGFDDDLSLENILDNDDFDDDNEYSDDVDFDSYSDDNFEDDFY
ncbi:MAG: plasmid pRiA4b ORF-3 family protein [Bacteroidales bacterium]|nr:plasmid pRiA4b ORF-3 family protein [Bacteroidales bacterium]